jgi:hypothetical protein
MTMREPTPEILAAAERLRRVKAGEKVTVVYPYSDDCLYPYTAMRDDDELLADAYLRLMDETPIDFDWLLSIGFEDDEVNRSLKIRQPLGNSVAYHFAGAAWYVNTSIMNDAPRTRGEVLMLLRALKINTKGGGDE